MVDLNPQPAATNLKQTAVRRPALKAVAVVIAGLALLAGGSYLVHRNAFTGAAECHLSVPQSSIDPLVFPRRDGPALLDSAIMENATGSVIHRLIQEQGGFSVPHGTTCSEVERGAIYSRVIVTEGPFAGKTVWAPTRHTHS